ncbi:hypothetical protein HBI12_220970 [Parastagonospora nodorum]|nr:hypothetical protein HBI12_220970 [Parastagonospora nodorum]
MTRRGKRLRDDSESPAEQQPTKTSGQLPPIAEEVTDSTSECNPSTDKPRISTSSSPASSPEPYFGSKQQKALSERARRAERRSSQNHTDTASPPTKRSSERKRAKEKPEDRITPQKDHKQLLRHASNVSIKRKFLKASLIGSSSGDEELLIQRKKPRLGESSHVSKKKTLEPLNLHKALKELRAAEAALTLATPQFLLSPTLENNIFARQTSMSQLPATTPNSPHNIGKPFANHKQATVEDESVKHVNAKASFNSPSPVSKNTYINDDASFLAFMRRLSASARKLAKENHRTPGSEDTSLSDESLGSGELNNITTAAGATAQQAQVLLQTLTGTRIATQRATQPPAAMTPAELYKFAQTALEQGAGNAIRGLQSANGYHDPNKQPLLFNNKPIEYNRRRTSLFAGSQPQSFTPMSAEDMYYCLKVDEQRYRSAFMTCPYLWQYFGGPADRSENPVSKYPL